MNIYKTAQGDTWDSIAFAFYGNEKYADILMKINYKKIKWFIFPAGVEIIISNIQENENEEYNLDYPEWRRDTDVTII